MATPEPGAKVAKDLNIYLGQIYGYIVKGTVKNHKADGKHVIPGGKGTLVDPDEVRAAMSSGRRKSTGPGKGKSSYVRKADRAARNDEAKPEPIKARKLAAGTMVSYERGRTANGTTVGQPKYTVAQVLGSTGKLTYLDEGNRRRHYEGTQIDNVVFFTDRLSTMMARGVAKIEKPTAVLGMILLSFIMDDQLDTAKSLEAWMVKNDIDVVIPEVMDLEDTDDDEAEPVRGLPTAIANGDDDD